MPYKHLLTQLVIKKRQTFSQTDLKVVGFLFQIITAPQHLLINFLLLEKYKNYY